MLAAELEGSSEGGTIITLAAFNLQDFLHERPVFPVQESGDGGPLRFESQAACSLPCR
jgi:hypothetical protein